MDDIRIVDEVLAQLTPRGFRNWTCLQVTALLIKRTPETPLHNKPVMLIILSKLGNVASGRAAAQPPNAGARTRERQHAGHLRGRPHAARPPHVMGLCGALGKMGGSEPAQRPEFGA